MKLETIFINNTDSRFVQTSGDYTVVGHLITGYLAEFKNSRRTMIKFENLTSLSGKKIVKAYLRLKGNGRPDKCTALPKEVFLHRIEEPYVNTIKWLEQPNFNPQPVTSIMVGETPEERFSWDITSLVKNWVDKKFPNYGLLLRQYDPYQEESTKYYSQNARSPILEVVYLVPN